MVRRDGGAHRPSGPRRAPPLPDHDNEWFGALAASLGGAGLRYHWHSTIVRADYGASKNRTAIYITFSQVF